MKEAGEYAPGSFLSSAFSNRMFGPTNEDILWEHQYKVITDLAAKVPASSWAAVRTTFCRTRRTA